jgi:hypothetical protein
VGGCLLFVRDGWLRPWFRRLGFRAELALSSAIVLALFLVGRGAGQVVTSVQPRRFVRASPRPTCCSPCPSSPSSRFILFLDLEGSTRLAERLGSHAYFELLRRFVDDLTEPVPEAEGRPVAACALTGAPADRACDASRGYNETIRGTHAANDPRAAIPGRVPVDPRQ